MNIILLPPRLCDPTTREDIISLSLSRSLALSLSRSLARFLALSRSLALPLAHLYDSRVRSCRRRRWSHTSSFNGLQERNIHCFKRLCVSVCVWQLQRLSRKADTPSPSPSPAPSLSVPALMICFNDCQVLPLPLSRILLYIRYPAWGPS